MSDDYTITQEDHFLRVVFHARPTIESAQALIHELQNSHNYIRRLWDLSQIPFDFDLKEIVDTASYGRKVFEQPSLAAFLVSDKEAYEKLRQVYAFRSDDLLKTGVFIDIEDARNWFATQSLPGAE